MSSSTTSTIINVGEILPNPSTAEIAPVIYQLVHNKPNPALARPAAPATAPAAARQSAPRPMARKARPRELCRSAQRHYILDAVAAAAEPVEAQTHAFVPLVIARPPAYQYRMAVHDPITGVDVVRVVSVGPDEDLIASFRRALIRDRDAAVQELSKSQDIDPSVPGLIKKTMNDASVRLEKFNRGLAKYTNRATAVGWTNFHKKWFSTATASFVDGEWVPNRLPEYDPTSDWKRTIRTALAHGYLKPRGQRPTIFASTALFHPIDQALRHEFEGRRGAEYVRLTRQATYDLDQLHPSERPGVDDELVFGDAVSFSFIKTRLTATPSATVFAETLPWSIGFWDYSPGLQAQVMQELMLALGDDAAEQAIVAQPGLSILSFNPHGPLLAGKWLLAQPRRSAPGYRVIGDTLYRISVHRNMTLFSPLAIEGTRDARGISALEVLNGLKSRALYDPTTTLPVNIGYRFSDEIPLFGNDAEIALAASQDWVVRNAQDTKAVVGSGAFEQFLIRKRALIYHMEDGRKMDVSLGHHAGNPVPSPKDAAFLRRAGTLVSPDTATTGTTITAVEPTVSGSRIDALLNLNVLVRGFDGLVTSVRVQRDTTADELVRTLYPKISGDTIDRLRLLHASKTIRGAEKLSALGITSGSTVHIVGTLVGGAFKRMTPKAESILPQPDPARVMREQDDRERERQASIEMLRARLSTASQIGVSELAMHMNDYTRLTKSSAGPPNEVAEEVMKYRHGLQHASSRISKHWDSLAPEDIIGITLQEADARKEGVSALHPRYVLHRTKAWVFGYRHNDAARRKGWLFYGALTATSALAGVAVAAHVAPFLPLVGTACLLAKAATVVVPTATVAVGVRRIRAKTRPVPARIVSKGELGVHAQSLDGARTGTWCCRDSKPGFYESLTVEKVASMVDRRHKIHSIPNMSHCSAPEKLGLYCVGPVARVGEMARNCSCNAVNALIYRHGAPQPRICTSLRLPAPTGLVEEIASAYALALHKYQQGWLVSKFIDGQEVACSSDKWTLAKCQAFLRSKWSQKVCPARTSIMIKMEVGKWTSPTEPDGLSKARLIMYYATMATQELLAREFCAFQDALKTVWSPGNPYHCGGVARRDGMTTRVTVATSCGAQPQEVANWAMGCLRRGRNAWIELDASRFDSTVNWTMINAKLEALRACSHRLADFAAAGACARGVFDSPNGALDVTLNSTTRSGQNDTTSGNTYMNGLLNIVAAKCAQVDADIIVAGDDMLAAITVDDTEHGRWVYTSWVRTLTQFGLIPEGAIFSDWRAVSFISSQFAGDECDLRLVPTFGRQASKIYWTDKLPPPDKRKHDSPWTEHRTAVAKGMMAVSAGLPLFDAMFGLQSQACDVTADGVNAVQGYTWRDQRNAPLPMHVAREWTRARYEIGDAELDDVVDFLETRAQSPMWMGQHPTLEKILFADGSLEARVSMFPFTVRAPAVSAISICMHSTITSGYQHGQTRSSENEARGATPCNLGQVPSVRRGSRLGDESTVSTRSRAGTPDSRRLLHAVCDNGVSPVTDGVEACSPGGFPLGLLHCDDTGRQLRCVYCGGPIGDGLSERGLDCGCISAGEPNNNANQLRRDQHLHDIRTGCASDEPSLDLQRPGTDIVVPDVQQVGNDPLHVVGSVQRGNTNGVPGADRVEQDGSVHGGRPGGRRTGDGSSKPVDRIPPTHRAGNVNDSSRGVGGGVQGRAVHAVPPREGRKPVHANSGADRQVSGVEHGSGHGVRDGRAGSAGFQDRPRGPYDSVPFHPGDQRQLVWGPGTFGGPVAGPDPGRRYGIRPDFHWSGDHAWTGPQGQFQCYGPYWYPEGGYGRQHPGAPYSVPSYPGRKGYGGVLPRRSEDEVLLPRELQRGGRGTAPDRRRTESGVPKDPAGGASAATVRTVSPRDRPNGDVEQAGVTDPGSASRPAGPGAGCPEVSVGHQATRDVPVSQQIPEQKPAQGSKVKHPKATDKTTRASKKAKLEARVAPPVLGSDSPTSSATAAAAADPTPVVDAPAPTGAG